MGRFLRPVALLLIALATAHAASGQPAQSGRTLLATVRDSRGNAMVDLELDDFLITEAGQEREVVDVHIADYPVVLLLDAGVEASVWPLIKAAAARFITRIGERSLAVGSLADGGTLAASLDDERAVVLSRLAAMPQDSGATGRTLPAVASAARRLKDTLSPFAAIVVVTARTIEATGSPDGTLMPAILETGATIHVIANRSGGPGPPDLLQVLASQTHGQYTAIFSSASFPTAIDRLADRMAAELMIQYLCPPDSEGTDVKIGVRRPGAIALGMGVSKQ